MSQNPLSVVPSEDCDLTEGVRGVNPHDGDTDIKVPLQKWTSARCTKERLDR